MIYYTAKRTKRPRLQVTKQIKASSAKRLYALPRCLGRRVFTAGVPEDEIESGLSLDHRKVQHWEPAT
ncbi:hypothetical protein ACFSKM_12025 [Ancylobacter dichloromethanicus]